MKMSIKASTLISTGAALLLLSGCSQHIGNFTALSTDAYNPDNLDQKHKVASNVETVVKSRIVLFFPIGGYTKLDQAVSETAHSNNGDFLKNAQVHHYWWSAILYGERGWKIKADVYNTQE